MLVYRADTRGPKTIAAEGFLARSPLSNPRDHLLSFCRGGKTPQDLSRLIISSPQPEYVSTDPDEACGGYSSKGYIYKIDISNLQQRNWDAGVLGEKLKKRPNAFWPKLFLDTNSLALANVIALQHFGNATNEVTFLTPIRASDIVGYKSGSGGFTSL